MAKVERVGTEKGRDTNASDMFMIDKINMLAKKSEGTGMPKEDQYRMQESMDQLSRRRKNEDAAAGKTRLTTDDKKY